MAQENKDEAIDREAVVPLPERDAMSIIGPKPVPVEGDLVPVVDPQNPIGIDPPSSE
jgi:hypothetical protein